MASKVRHSFLRPRSRYMCSFGVRCLGATSDWDPASKGRRLSLPGVAQRMRVAASVNGYQPSFSRIADTTIHAAAVENRTETISVGHPRFKSFRPRPSPAMVWLRRGGFRRPWSSGSKDNFIRTSTFPTRSLRHRMIQSRIQPEASAPDRHCCVRRLLPPNAEN